MKFTINNDIAFTHIFTRKKQTLVASLGVAIGVGIYLFMNSLNYGFSNFSTGEIFKNNAHIKIYKDDEMSKPLVTKNADGYENVIINPQITTLSKTLNNPNALLAKIKKESYIVNAIAQVNFDAFYNRGKTQVKGSGFGVNIKEYSDMFNTRKYMVSGDLNDLQNNSNGIIIGSGMAEKLSLNNGDKITVSSSYGVTKVLNIVGIFTSGNFISDNTRSYVNIATAQQFLKEGTSFVTTIFANTANPKTAENYIPQLKTLSDYTVEDWKVTNSDVVASDKTRSTMMGAISLAILLVASFGIYNILNMTVSQKINDIAILKAIGFNSKDVVKIFVVEALIMGVLGTVGGLLFASVLIKIVSGIYMGGPVGYFPIGFEGFLYLRAFLLGVLVTFFAGYFPARKASKVDPVSIFRK